MNRLGQDLLAGSGIASDEHGGVDGSDEPGASQQLGHDLAAMHHLGGEVFGAEGVPSGLRRQALADLGDQRLALDGFGQEGAGPQVSGLDRLRDAGLTAHDDHGHDRIVAVYLPQQAYAVDRAHHQVRDHQVRPPRLELVQRRLPAVCGGDVQTLQRKPALDQRKMVPVVVHQQDVFVLRVVGLHEVL